MSDFLFQESCRLRLQKRIWNTFGIFTVNFELFRILVYLLLSTNTDLSAKQIFQLLFLQIILNKEIGLICFYVTFNNWATELKIKLQTTWLDFFFCIDGFFDKCF